MLPKTVNFLRLLDQNNNKEWFTANKQLYLDSKAEFEVFVDRLIPLTREIDPQIGMISVSDCTYRIYKDTRFSKDKTPYKTHMGAYINRGGKKSPFAGYYIHIEPSGMSLWGGGLYCPDRDLLTAVRRDIFENADEFKQILFESDFSDGFELQKEEMLKKAPLGFPSDFADIDLLKHKNYSAVKFMPKGLDCSEKLLESTIEAFKALAPLNKFLNYTVEQMGGSHSGFANSITFHP